MHIYIIGLLPKSNNVQQLEYTVYLLYTYCRRHSEEQQYILICLKFYFLYYYFLLYIIIIYTSLLMNFWKQFEFAIKHKYTLHFKQKIFCVRYRPSLSWNYENWPNLTAGIRVAGPFLPFVLDFFISEDLFCWILEASSSLTNNQPISFWIAKSGSFLLTNNSRESASQQNRRHAWTTSQMKNVPQ